jgi:hypothetical protein
MQLRIDRKNADALFSCRIGCAPPIPWALLGAQALWRAPASFVAMMTLGGALGMASVSVSFVEIAIGLSVVALGAAVALPLNMRVAAAMAFVGFFAIFRGHAHGAEMPDTASGFEYGLAFMFATATVACRRHRPVGRTTGAAARSGGLARAARLARRRGPTRSGRGAGSSRSPRRLRPRSWRARRGGLRCAADGRGRGRR